LAARQRGILIVTLRSVEDIASAKRRISRLDGVVAVNFNQLNRKMLVRYEGDEAMLTTIKANIREILDGSLEPERRRALDLESGR
jgi:hypothetical protein